MESRQNDLNSNIQFSSITQQKGRLFPAEILMATVVQVVSTDVSIFSNIHCYLAYY